MHPLETMNPKMAGRRLVAGLPAGTEGQPRRWRRGTFGRWLAASVALSFGSGILLVAVLAWSTVRLADRASSLPQAGIPLWDREGPNSVGPFAVGWRDVTIARRTGGSFEALLVYPAEAAGAGAQIEPRGGPYPGIVFGHGFFQSPDRYSGTFEHLASHGYIVLAPRSFGGLQVDHQQFAADLIAGWDWLVAQRAAADSPLRGVVAPRCGLAGHSMGGGASLLAAAAGVGGIRAAVTLAAADTRPGARERLSQVRVPLAFLVGSEDAIVPADQTAQLYAAALPPKQLVTIVGGSHCGFQDAPFPIGCDRGSLPREEQLAITRERMTAFFDLYLKEQRERFAAVWGPPGDPRLMIVSQLQSGTGGWLYLPSASQLNP